MSGSVPAVRTIFFMAALAPAAIALAAPPQVTTKSDRNGTTTTITQSATSGNGSSRRQITVTRRRSSGGRSTKAPGYKVGDKVKVEWGNEVNDGEVIGFARTGWIEVSIDHRGREMTLTLPPDKIWRVPERKVTAADRKLRTWSSRNGKFTIKGKFVELDEDDNLTLQKENGETLVVALDKLSEGDEKLARQLADRGDQADQVAGASNKQAMAADRKLRTWSSRNGKFTVKGKFVKLDGDDNLTLQKENGETLVVALDKLSEGDEKLARQLADGGD